jgi:hypothetical protein
MAIAFRDISVVVQAPIIENYTKMWEYKSYKYPYPQALRWGFRQSYDFYHWQNSFRAL